MTTIDQDNFAYDVALSFAGEDRAHAEKLAQLLQAKGIKVFYDEHEVAELWGKDLIPHLAEIYSKKARFCVMFVSEHYPLKRWTDHERSHAQARAFRDPNEYILPLRLDDTEVPGLSETIGYIDFRHRSIESVAELLEEKLAKAKGKADVSSATQSSEFIGSRSPISSIPMPRRKKSFTQLEKDRFAREAFNYIKQYFRQGLQDLESRYSDIDTDFNEITSVEFTSKIYVQGNTVAQCVIWLGDTLLPNTIYYGEGMHGLRRGSSFNDWLPVEESEGELCLRIQDMPIGNVQVDEPLATKEQAATHLWKRLTHRLEQH